MVHLRFYDTVQYFKAGVTSSNPKKLKKQIKIEME